MPSPLVVAMTGNYSLEWAPPAIAAGYTTPETEAGYGAYLNVGQTAVAKVFKRSFAVQPVVSDLYGQNAMLDGIQQGVVLTLAMDLAEYTANVRHLLWPWGMTVGGVADFGIFPQAGTRMSQYWGLIRLTAATGSPAAAPNGPATFIAKAAVVAPDSPHEMMMGTVWRRSPITMNLFPYFDGTNYRNFAVT